MRRHLLITEEFGMYRVETSSGHKATGPSVAKALRKLSEEAGIAAGDDADFIFENAIPKQERRDGPVSA